jgi:hypothetical protein
MPMVGRFLFYCGCNDCRRGGRDKACHKFIFKVYCFYHNIYFSNMLYKSATLIYNVVAWIPFYGFTLEKFLKNSIIIKNEQYYGFRAKA